MNAGQLVEVHWIDSSGTSGWVYRGGEFDVCVIKSIGFVVKQTDEHLTLCHSIDERNEMISGVHTIPNVCITNIWVIETRK